MDEQERESLAASEGPSPTDDDVDAGETMEELISDMDRPMGSQDHTTAEEQREGDSIEERTRREQPDWESAEEQPGERLDVTEDVATDAFDEEPQLVGDAADALGPQAPEQAAMHVVEEAPGATDHPDDYVDGPRS